MTEETQVLDRADDQAPVDAESNGSVQVDGLPDLDVVIDPVKFDIPNFTRFMKLQQSLRDLDQEDGLEEDAKISRQLPLMIELFELLQYICVGGLVGVPYYMVREVADAIGKSVREQSAPKN